MPAELTKVKELFLQALELSIAERPAFLDQACGGDAQLRQQLDAMLQSHENSGELLPHTPADAGATDVEATSAFADRPVAAATQAEPGQTEADELSFLRPSACPDSLGRLGHYEVKQVIGKGGFGVVLKAFDERLHRVVAIKVLAPAFAAHGSARKRFIREARAAAAVKNEHVVGIHDVQEEAQPPYLVMELIDGISLQDKLDRHGTLGVKEVLRIGMQIAEGLAAAHRQGLVHRDIKPANILLENGVERVKITDFGLARAVDDASVTQSGTVAGTPMYMSPEQAEGLAVDHRSDLFSLGTVLYAMCTGHPPFRASSTHAVLKRVIDAAPRPIQEVNSDIPEWLSALIAKLHAKQPAERFQTAKEVAELLAKCLSDSQAQGGLPASPVAAAMDAVTVSVGKPCRRSRSRLVAGVLAVVGLGLVAAAFAVPPRPAGLLLALAGSGTCIAALTILATAMALGRTSAAPLDTPTTAAAPAGPPSVAPREYHVIRFILVYLALAGPLFGVCGLLDLYTDLDGPQLGWIFAGLFALLAVAVAWRYARIRMARRRTALSYSLAAVLGATALAGLGPQLEAWLVSAVPTGELQMQCDDPTLWLSVHDDAAGKVVFAGHAEGFPIAGSTWTCLTLPTRQYTVSVYDADKKRYLHGESLFLAAGKMTPLFVPKQTAAQAAAQGQKAGAPAEPWEQLFDGKSFGGKAGWRVIGSQPGNWNVSDGRMIGTGGPMPIFTFDRTYRDFHLRMEADINTSADAGLFFRLDKPGPSLLYNYFHGYAVGIKAPHVKEQPGTIFQGLKKPVHNGKDVRLEPGKLFTIEVIAKENHLVVKVDGTVTADVVDPDHRHAAGYFGLRLFNTTTFLRVRKFEVRELPPN